MRVLIVGNLTIDKTPTGYRVGGASYYGGWALQLLGLNVHILTSISNKYRKYYNELYNYFQIHEQPCKSNPVFIISSGRAVGIAETGCVIDANLFLDITTSINPDFIILAPVYREIDKQLIRTARRALANKVISLDIQGITRRYANESLVNIWDKDLEESLQYVELVHGNKREYAFSSDIHEIIRYLRRICGNTYYIVSMDDKGLFLVSRGFEKYFPAPRVRVVNEVGAGDVLLAVTTYYYARKHDIIEAIKYGIAAAALKVSSNNMEWFTHEELNSFVNSIE